MTIIRTTLAVFGGSLLLLACSDHDAARRFFERGDYAEAHKRFKSLAEKGDVQAQFDLAHMYFSGVGVSPDVETGLGYLVASATGGNAVAMVELAMRYASGIGTKQSLVMAARWYRRAAHLGEPIAAFNLASMHEVGTEVAKDQMRAYAWYMIALKNGNVAARARADELRSKMLREDVEQAEALIKKLLTDPEA